MKALIDGIQVEGQPEEIAALMRALSSSVGRTTRRRPEQKQPRRKAPASASTRAARQLQGRYMGYVRQLTKPQKAQVQKVLQRDGKEAAVAEARKLAEGGKS